jgi:hypothetical protein
MQLQGVAQITVVQRRKSSKYLDALCNEYVIDVKENPYAKSRMRD